MKKLISLKNVSMFNVLIGILPIFITLLNTPAYILSRHDVD